MQITDIAAEKVSIPLRQPIKVTFGTVTEVETLIITIKTDSQFVGYGEACPFEPVTGETLDSELAALAVLTPALVHQNPVSIERLHHLMDSVIVGHTALKAGLDMAFYDLLGKQAGLPVYQLLGGDSNRVRTDITIAIGTPAKMAKEAQEYAAAGFTELKIKAGVDVDQDRAALAAIIAAVDPSVTLKIDANQGWTTKQTVRFLSHFADTALTMVEQPLPASQLANNSIIRQQVSQDLILDESVHSPADASQVVQAGLADVINIKLMKSSGLYGANAINQIAAAAGVQCMIGCMAETRLGIAAAAHFAAAHRNLKYCDLDSFMMFAEPDWLTGGFTREKDELVLSNQPGLGIEINR